MKVGVSRIDITPPVGVRLSGFAGRDFRSAAVRDRLTATALHLSDGATSAAVIALDTIGLSIADDAALRRAAGWRAGVAPDHVLVACSHTHAGAATMGIRATGDKEVSWTRTVLERVADALRDARDAAVPVDQIQAGEAPCHASVNRRNPEGFRDPACRVLVLGAPTPVAALFHFAMHPVSLGHPDRRLSADWVAEARGQLEMRLNCPVLYLQGCCGDINPRVRDADLVGAEVGAALYHALEAATGRPATLAVGVGDARIPFRALPAPAVLTAALAKAKATRANPGPWLGNLHVADAEIAWVAACRRLRRAGDAGPKTVAARVPAVTIADIPIVGLPGEVFASIGERVRDAVPGAWPVAFAAGNPGYLYPDDALEAGGYEVDLAYKLYGERQADAGTADALVAAARDAAR